MFTLEEIRHHIAELQETAEQALRGRSMDDQARAEAIREVRAFGNNLAQVLLSEEEARCVDR